MPPLLQLEHLTKIYPGVVALNKVSFEVQRGHVHCLVGENGAGKSTLIKILAGAEQPSSGQVFLEGKPVRLSSPSEARKQGLSFIFQEVNVVEQLSVADNFSLGQEGRTWGVWRRKRDVQLAQDFLGRLGVTDIDPRLPMAKLGPAKKQLVEIARALASHARLIVMDEPSAPLTEHELESLFHIIALLKSEGVTMIYVSHRLSEVFKIGDSYTVLRDGQHIQTGALTEVRENDLIQMMVGRDLQNIFTRTRHPAGDCVLALEQVNQGFLKNISFKVHQGEIVGVAGLAGAGRTALANVIFGLRPAQSGRILINGQPVRLRSPRQAIRQHIGLVPEERRAQGIVGEMSVRENISLACPKRVSVAGLIQKGKDKALAQGYIQKLGVKTPSSEQRIKNLSGGNQQKVVIARWLATGSRLLMLDEPTRGIDVGAKAEVFALMDALAAEGNALLMFSSEMEELLGMSDRILVMHRGEIVAEFPIAEASQEKILQYAIGD